MVLAQVTRSASRAAEADAHCYIVRVSETQQHFEPGALVGC
jgi:hypothetical protein